MKFIETRCVGIFWLFEIALPTKPVGMHVCPSLILYSKTTFVLCDATFPNATQNVVWL